MTLLALRMLKAGPSRSLNVTIVVNTVAYESIWNLSMRLIFGQKKASRLPGSPSVPVASLSVRALLGASTVGALFALPHLPEPGPRRLTGDATTIEIYGGF